jgi:putative ABC transport system permease protein
MQAFSQELRFSIRRLRRSPGFSLTAILTLALGIGAVTSVFSVVNSVLLKPFAFRDPSRLVVLRETVEEMAKFAPTLPDNPKHYMNLKAQSRTLQDAAIFQTQSFTVGTENDHPRITNGLVVSPNFFSVLGVQPMLGRAFTPQEATQGHDDRVILTWEAWQRYFQGDPRVIGRTLRIYGGPHTVVGVLPKGFNFPMLNMMPAPLRGEIQPLEIFQPLALNLEAHPDKGDFNYLVLARVKPGVSIAQAQSELQGLQQAFALSKHLNIHLGVVAIPLTEEVAGNVSAGLWLLLAAVGAVLLIACVNLANLQLARTVLREREIAVRAALGAGPMGLLQLALMESLLLAASGGTLGILLSFTGVRLFLSAAPANLPRLDEVQISWPVLLFAAGLAITTALLFGMVPALRSMHVDPRSAIQTNSTRVANSRQGQRTRNLLVSTEIACTVVLLIVTALMMHSFDRLLTQRRDFDADQVTAAEVDLFNPHYEQSLPNVNSVKSAFIEGALAGLSQIPGVKSAAVTSQMPLTGEVWIDGLIRADHPVPEGQQPLVNIRSVSPSYRNTLKIPLLEGRDLDPSDRDHPGNALISLQTARAAWPGEDPVGKTFDSEGTHTVVGVVADARVNDLKKTANMVYLPYWENPRWRLFFLVRSSLPASALADSIRGVIWNADPQVAIPVLKSLDALVDDSVATDRFQTLLLSSFGIAALLLALLGVYGVLAYSVSLRQQEFGIRIALGSGKAALMRLVVRQASYPVMAGVLVGLGGAFVATRSVQSLLYQTQTTDPAAIAASILLLMATAALAVILPAHRAAAVDPMEVLRKE